MPEIQNIFIICHYQLLSKSGTDSSAFNMLDNYCDPEGLSNLFICMEPSHLTRNDILSNMFILSIIN